MRMPDRIEPDGIAPCGVNCLACSAHLSDKTPCPGCRAPSEEITRKSCRDCEKKKCAFGQGIQWCFQCRQFPCQRIRGLNERYRKNYGVDLVQNGLDAKRDWNSFLLAQKERFSCAVCGQIIDQHHRRCSGCGREVT